MPAYALNSNDRNDRRISRDTLVRLPSAYNYCFPAFSGGTITGPTLLATYPRSRHVRHAPTHP